MATFYLIRHAANDTLGKTLVGWTPGVHLNAEGHQQAERLAEYLEGEPIQQILSSPLERAVETALPLARRLGLEIQTRHELGEVQFGDWTGQSFEALAPQPAWRQWNTFRSGTAIPHGETIVEVQTRMVRQILQLQAGFPDQSIAIFSHGDPLRATVLYFLGMPLDFLHRIDIRPASVSILALSEHGPRLLCINDRRAEQWVEEMRRDGG